jgi:uncharacterized membrane protein YfcA
MESSWLVYLILLVSTLIRSTFGFGDALVAMPLLALVVGLQAATPLVALCASTIALTILLRNWRKVRIQSAWRLIVSSILGIPLGLLYLKGTHEDLLGGILAIVLIGFGSFSLARPRWLRIRGESWAYAFGFVAGILGGAYNTNGPPVVIYGTLKRWDPLSFRATLQGYFLPTSLFIVLGHGMAGLWAPAVLHSYLSALPLVLLAIYLGGRINRTFAAQKFSRYVHLLLIALGLLLLWRTLD